MLDITNHISRAALYALTASLLILALLASAFFLIEPTVSRGQSDTATFVINHTITDETSFLVNPSTVTATGSISGVTGGNATGSTQFVVQSNNTSGYYVEIDFFDNGTDQTMLGNVSASEAITDYQAELSEPTYGFSTSTSAQFAYTVMSTTSSHTDGSFLNNGGACNAGGQQYPTGDHCWMTPSTTAFRIVDTSTAATTGATSTIQFKIHVPSNASPLPPADVYTATATLSLFSK